METYRGYEYRGSYRPGLPSECESPLTSGQTLTYVRPKSDDDYEGVFGYVTERTMFTENFHAFAAHINGRNLIAATTSSAALPSSSAPDVAGVTSTSSLGSSASTNAPGDSAGNIKLSPGAIAGIAVGAVLGLAAIGLVAFWLMRRRKRGGDEYTSAAPHSEMAGESQGEKKTGHQAPLYELPSSQVHELSGHAG